MVGFDANGRSLPGLGENQLQTDPRQIGSASVLNPLEHRRVCCQQRRHPGHGQPEQHLVTHDHAERGRSATLEPAFGGGRDQRKGARPRQGQKQEDGSAEGAEVGDAEHGEDFSGERADSA